MKRLLHLVGFLHRCTKMMHGHTNVNLCLLFSCCTWRTNYVFYDYRPVFICSIHRNGRLVGVGWGGSQLSVWRMSWIFMWIVDLFFLAMLIFLWHDVIPSCRQQHGCFKRSQTQKLIYCKNFLRSFSFRRGVNGIFVLLAFSAAWNGRKLPTFWEV